MNSEKKGCWNCLHQPRRVADCISAGCSAGRLTLWEPQRQTPKGQPDAQGRVWGCGHDCRDPDCDGCKVVGHREIDVDNHHVELTPVTGDWGAPLPENPKAIHGRLKPTLELVPGGAMIPMARVFELGASKYGAFNWRRDPVEAGTYVSAAQRHLLSWFDGEDIDPESGQPHIAHVACCMAILLDAASCGKLIDNRPHKGTSADLIRALTKPLETNA